MGKLQNSSRGETRCEMVIFVLGNWLKNQYLLSKFFLNRFVIPIV